MSCLSMSCLSIIREKITVAMQNRHKYLEDIHGRLCKHDFQLLILYHWIVHSVNWTYQPPSRLKLNFDGSENNNSIMVGFVVCMVVRNFHIATVVLWSSVNLRETPCSPSPPWKKLACKDQVQWWNIWNLLDALHKTLTSPFTSFI